MQVDSDNEDHDKIALPASSSVKPYLYDLYRRASHRHATTLTQSCTSTRDAACDPLRPLVYGKIPGTRVQVDAESLGFRLTPKVTVHERQVQAVAAVGS